MELCQEEGVLVVIRLVKIVLNLVQIGIPIILIVLGTIDLGKAVVASKDDEIKKAQGMLIKRIIYAVVIFFVVLLIKFLFNTVGNLSDSTEGAKNWVQCWNNAND